VLVRGEHLRDVERAEPVKRGEEVGQRVAVVCVG
jgi:hypothetical protein